MIKSFDYLKTLEPIYEKIVASIERVLNSGNLILGPETENFERDFSRFTGSEYCIGVNSGTSALVVALMALGIGSGDEVITVANTCVPTIAAIEMVGAKPVFVDVNEKDLMINPELVEKAINDKTKAIIPVHLWGQSVDIERLVLIAKKFGLKVIEDCAQATGTMFNYKHVGNFGDVGCFSFYPTKNLGAYGDAGAIITNNSEIAEKIRKIRMYGYDNERIPAMKGTNARISEIQAAILKEKLKHLPMWLKRKREISDYYMDNITNADLKLPHIYTNREHSFHQFVIRSEKRDMLGKWLNNNSIEYGIHYPVPIHQMPLYKKRFPPKEKLFVTDSSVKEIISIPIHESLRDKDVQKIVEILNKFKKIF